MKSGKRHTIHVRLWVLMALFFTMILSVIVSAIILTYRTSIERRYKAELRTRMYAARQSLSQKGYTPEAAEEVSAQGLPLLLVEEESCVVLYESVGGIPLGVLQEAKDAARYRAADPPRRDAQLLRELVRQRLGREDGGDWELLSWGF